VVRLATVSERLAALRQWKRRLIVWQRTSQIFDAGCSERRLRRFVRASGMKSLYLERCGGESDSVPRSEGAIEDGRLADQACDGVHRYQPCRTLSLTGL